MNRSEDGFSSLVIALMSRSTAEIIVESVLFGCICVTAVLGNLLTLIAIFRNAKLRTIPNMFVTSLAVSDLGVGIFAMPLSLSVEVSSQWLFSPMVCQFEGYITLVMASASTQTLAAIAINRYFVVVKWILYRTTFTKRRMVYIMILIWASSFLAPFVYLTTDNRFVWNPGKLFCYLDLKVRWFISFFVLLYVGCPAVVILFCYIRVFQTINKRNKRFSSNEDSVTLEEIKMTRTLFVIVVCFTICWTPIIIIDNIDTLNGKFVAPRIVYLFYTFLACISSTVNPVVYGIMSPVFRREFMNTLCAASCKKHDRKIAQVRTIAPEGCPNGAPRPDNLKRNFYNVAQDTRL